MSSCIHSRLVLLPEVKSRLQCDHCHLTIKADDLGEGYCPECFEASGKKLYDFKEMPEKEPGNVRYRCEECGIIIESE
jgi:hypothetical protein